MSAEIFKLHKINPEIRKVKKIVEALKDGAVILYPTDTGFTLGCQLANKNAIEQLRRIRGITTKKALTFLCKDLSNISTFATVSNLAYKTIKSLIPGPYTFILPATKQVPKLAQHPTRKTAGIRVPDSVVVSTLLEIMEEPIISITAKLPSFEDDFLTPEETIDQFIKLVDIVVCMEEYNFLGESTVIDMITNDFTIMRKGAGYENVSYLEDI
ncbi:MAG: threonylcarbamoyl-AMP synthase [Ignavibacteria bacterium]|jgi:tRNA threonylcarbamoyl adenosine modification protein (Sua5/YciO/YrdC/YwlC family)|nr:threonylcarbamoyl-AMP synthase [Ignavibacteria bacterium]